MKGRAYLRLMRFDKPAGILLLWFPTAWALWIANKGTPPFHLILYFFCGTVFMRAAGCVMNDMADRNIDKHVQRTKMRPLTTGEVTLFEAFGLLIGLGIAALLMLMQLPKPCFYYAFISLFVTLLYPFCKRFFQAPQLILGIAFSMGIPMAYAASGVMPNISMAVLFALNFFWIVAYDTLYAMADRVDDIRIGIKSTAILFAGYDRVIILMLQVVLQGLWLLLAFMHHFSNVFYLGWLMASLVLIYQQLIIRGATSNAYLTAFSSNTLYGFFRLLGLFFTPIL